MSTNETGVTTTRTTGPAMNADDEHRLYELVEGAEGKGVELRTVLMTVCRQWKEAAVSAAKEAEGEAKRLEHRIQAQ